MTQLQKQFQVTIINELGKHYFIITYLLITQK